MVTVLGHRLERRADGAVLGGVCTGLARTLRIDLSVVRFGFLALSLAGGLGVVLYLLGWAVLPSAAAGADTGPVPTDRIDNAAAVAAILGAVLVLRAGGIWLSDEVGVIGGLAMVGVALVWGRAGGAEAMLHDRRSSLRLAVGVCLVVVGFLAFVLLTGDLRTLGRSLLGATVATVGVLLIIAPRLARLADDVAMERRARMRSEEKAAIAAHLHDGVLQTLALIQRRAGDNREVATLARRQERELREWLYGADRSSQDTLATALARDLASVEDDLGVRVELVCVGDAPLDDATRAVGGAVREAATNAARHSGVETVDVYVEATDAKVTAYVRDRGLGFEPDAVGPDRRGVADSIVGRMQRAGGTASIRTAPGEGTEVVLEVPRRRP